MSELPVTERPVFGQPASERPAGGRALTWVLIPGAGGSAWYWHRVAPLLRACGDEVLAVELPADDDSAGLADYADTVVRAVGERTGRAELAVVAQSLGGFVAPIVCERLPVSLLVLVNAMIPAPGETAGEWWANTGQAEARRAADLRAGRDPDADFDPQVTFLHDVPAAVIEDPAGSERPQSATVFGAGWTLTAWPPVTTRVAIARDDRFFPADFQRRVAQQRLGIGPDELPGGHLNALSYPAELAGQLLAYAASMR